MITKHDIGSGIVCILKDTPDDAGIEININGVFRHGGLSHDEIKVRVQKCFDDLDVDVNSPPEKDNDENGQELQNVQLMKQYKSLHHAIYVVESYSVNDLVRLETLADKLNKRGYEIIQTIEFRKGDNDAEDRRKG